MPAPCRGTLGSCAGGLHGELRVGMGGWDCPAAALFCSLGFRTSSLSRSQTSHARADCGSGVFYLTLTLFFVGFNCQYLKARTFHIIAIPVFLLSIRSSDTWVHIRTFQQNCVRAVPYRVNILFPLFSHFGCFLVSGHMNVGHLHSVQFTYSRKYE